MLNKIRAGIFFAAGLLLFLFPRRVFRMQCKVMNYLIRKFRPNYSYGKSKNGVVINRVFGVVFWLVAVVLLVLG